jgi:hypothetical protein
MFNRRAPTKLNPHTALFLTEILQMEASVMPRLPLTLALFKLESIDKAADVLGGMSFPIASPTSFLPSSGQGRLKWTPFLGTKGKRHAFDAGVRSDAESADERPERLLRQEQLDGELVIRMTTPLRTTRTPTFKRRISLPGPKETPCQL